MIDDDLSHERDDNAGSAEEPTHDSIDSVTPDPFLAEVARIPASCSAPPSVPALRPGDTVGRFVVRGELGRGGMGVVYAAEDPTLGREVALKVLPLSGDHEPRRRFLREAQAAAALSDPGIATVYDVGEATGRVFIAMELLHGRTLRALLAARPASDRALPVPEALRIGRAISRALAVAHGRGLVHRDLKPENVMITESGLVKILDFGLVKRTAPALCGPTEGTSSVELGRVLGTPGYMSPEQAKGRPVDVPSDVFSLGVILYEMITGRRPFDRATTVETFVAIDRDDPPPPSRVSPHIPAAFERAILRCLRKAPATRYANAAELLRELEAISASRAPARSRVVAGVAAALVAAGMVAFAVTRSPASRVTEKPPAVTASPVVTPTAVTDQPAPSTTSAEALAGYREALAAYRDGDEWTTRLKRVVELDPALAPVHLKLASVAMGQVVPSVREHFRKAEEQRAKLTERDRGLLDAIEPVVRRQPAEWAEANRRLAALLGRFPGDAELWYLLAVGTHNFEDFEAAIEHNARAIALDPGFAPAYAAMGMEQAYIGRFGETRRTVERCLAAVPSASGCLGLLALVQSHAGDCEGEEATARRLVASGKNTPRAYWMLAGALAARGQPVSSVREALHQANQAYSAMPGVDADGRERHAFGAAIVVDLLNGDLQSAEEKTRAHEKVTASSRRQEEHGQAALMLVQILAERGRAQDAAAVAMDFLERRDAWEPDPSAEDVAMGRDATPSLLLAARRGGRLRRAELAARRAAWLKTWSARVTPVAKNFLWLHGWTRSVDDADDAREALAALPSFGTPAPFRPLTPVEGDAGRTFLLGGRLDEAVGWLEQFTRSCTVLEFPVSHTRAHLLLGQAREAKGDPTAACAAYQVVLERWSKAKPRSVTLEKAKERVKALRCSG